MIHCKKKQEQEKQNNVLFDIVVFISKVTLICVFSLFSFLPFFLLLFCCYCLKKQLGTLCILLHHRFLQHCTSLHHHHVFHKVLFFELLSQVVNAAASYPYSFCFSNYSPMSSLHFHCMFHTFFVSNNSLTSFLHECVMCVSVLL